MPFKDGSGPNGQGARTGRGAGNCNGQGGTGRGRGFGRRGGGLGVNANATRGNSWIQTQLNDLQAAIEKLTERLNTSGK